jgi:hypothetical protein
MERAIQFHWNDLLPSERDGKTETEWRFKRKAGNGTRPDLLITHTLFRAPRSFSFHVRNNSPKPISFGLVAYELDWHKPKDGSYAQCLMRYEPVVAAGAEADVSVPFPDADAKWFPARMSLVTDGAEDETEYDIFLSNLVVHYADADGVEASLTAPLQSAASSPIRFEVKASGIRAESVTDIEVRDEPHVLWRIRLTNEEKQSLVATGNATVSRDAPWYLPARELSAGLVVNGYRAGEDAPIAFTNATQPALPETERREYNGRPTFFVDGKPFTWSGYASYDFLPGSVSEFGASGVDMFVVATDAGAHVHQIAAPTWLGGDRYDFGELDERVAMGLQANPGAFITLRVSLALPAFWIRQHEESRARVRTDAVDLPWFETGYAAVSLASEEWRAQQAECLRKLLRHCKEQPWARRVAAVIIGGEVTEEWFAWGANDKQYADYSAPNAAAFAAWCKEKGLPFTDMPSPADRDFAGYDVYPSNDAGKRSAAYALYASEKTAETISYFAKAVKDETQGRCFVGAFYGYVLQLAGESRQHTGGHFALRALLDDPNVDYLLGIPLHNYRRYIDGYDLYTTATESVFAHGKGYANENDLFSWLHNGLWYTEYEPADPRKGAIRMHQRVTGDDLVHGVSRQWFSLLASWHHDAGLQAEFAREIALNRNASRYDRTSADEVAFVVDDTSFASMPPASTLARATNLDLLYALGRTGTPVGVWLLSDLDRLPERVRVVVVASATAARPQDLDKLRALIREGRRTLVVVGPVGLVNPGTMDWNTSATRELLGLPISIEDAAAPGVASLVEGGREVSHLPSMRPRAMLEGDGWLRYSDGKTAGGERALANGGRLVWCGVPPLDTPLLRQWLQSAGVHFYAPEGFTVHASKQLVSVTASVSGDAELHWPQETTATDLFDGRKASGATTVFPFEAGQTRLFALTEP